MDPKPPESSLPDAEVWLAGLASTAARAVLEKLDFPGDDAAIALQRRLEAELRKAPHVAQWSRAGPTYRVRNQIDGGARLEAVTYPERNGMEEFDAAMADLLRSLGAEGSPLRVAGEKGAAEWTALAQKQWATLRSQLVLFREVEQVELGEVLVQEFRNMETIYSREPQREDAKARHWRERQARAARFLARVLWHGEVLAAVEEARPRQPATLSLLVLEDIAHVYRRDATVQVHPEGKGKGIAEIVGPDGEVLAHTPLLKLTVLEDARRGVRALRSYLGIQVLRTVPGEVWRRHVAGEQYPNKLTFHGTAGFLDYLGVSSAHHASALAILGAGQHFERTWGDNDRPGRKIGGLWTYDLDDSPGPGKPARLDLTVGSALSPFFVRKELTRSDDRALVPIVPMPPKVGAARLWAAQAALQEAIVIALVERRLEVAEHGGALLTRDDLEGLARDSGLDVEHLERVLGAWLEGDERGPALERVEPDRYHLGKRGEYGRARAYIDATGKRALGKRQEYASRRRPRRGRSN